MSTTNRVNRPKLAASLGLEAIQVMALPILCPGRARGRPAPDFSSASLVHDGPGVPDRLAAPAPAGCYTETEDGPAGRDGVPGPKEHA